MGFISSWFRFIISVFECNCYIYLFTSTLIQNWKEHTISNIPTSTRLSLDPSPRLIWKVYFPKKFDKLTAVDVIEGKRTIRNTNWTSGLDVLSYLSQLIIVFYVYNLKYNANPYLLIKQLVMYIKCKIRSIVSKVQDLYLHCK